MTDFDDLLARVKALTGLEGRDAAKVAFDLADDPRPQDIIDKAIELGYDVDKKHGQSGTTTREIAPELTMNPAEVLSEVYMTMPRVLCTEMPKMGRAPEEAQAEFSEILEQLPEDVRAMLVKIDMIEGAATFWIRDEANEIDRPIGPIDITRYDSEHALEQAFNTLMQRMNKILAADFN